MNMEPALHAIASILSIHTCQDAMTMGTLIVLDKGTTLLIKHTTTTSNYYKIKNYNIGKLLLEPLVNISIMELFFIPRSGLNVRLLIGVLFGHH